MHDYVSDVDAVRSLTLWIKQRVIIVKMIMDRTKHTGGTLDLSESLDNLGLDSMEAVTLIFDIEEKFNIQIPVNANMDIESKTLADLIQAVDRLVAAKVKSNRGNRIDRHAET